MSGNQDDSVLLSNEEFRKMQQQILELTAANMYLEEKCLSIMQQQNSAMGMFRGLSSRLNLEEFCRTKPHRWSENEKPSSERQRDFNRGTIRNAPVYIEADCHEAKEDFGYDRIVKLEEIVSRRTQQVEQLTIRLSDLSLQMSEGGIEDLKKRIGHLETWLRCSQKREKELEDQLSLSEGRLRELFIIQTCLSASQDRCEYWRKTAELAVSNKRRLESHYDRAIYMLALYDTRAERSIAVGEQGVQTSSILWNMFENKLVCDRYLEVADAETQNSTPEEPFRKSGSEPDARYWLTRRMSSEYYWLLCSGSPSTSPGEWKSLMMMLKKERLLRTESDRKAQDLLSFHNTFRRKSKGVVRFGRTSVYDFS